ncbi:hypothetical protein AB0I84_32465 [Streptomyces spectabilis]|uniref:hypothetical protein n=1 Tax=Streptomyces spectabilis TaxID=68270 RepID=UPI003406612B
MSDQGNGVSTDGGSHVSINTISGGAQAFGKDGIAVSGTSTTVVASPAHADLLASVRRLRHDLEQGERAAEDEVLDAELADVEGEITRTGRSGAERLARVRDRLAQYAPASATAASVTAVLQALAQLPQLPG